MIFNKLKAKFKKNPLITSSMGAVLLIIIVIIVFLFSTIGSGKNSLNSSMESKDLALQSNTSSQKETQSTSYPNGAQNNSSTENITNTTANTVTESPAQQITVTQETQASSDTSATTQATTQVLTTQAATTKNEVYTQAPNAVGFDDSQSFVISYTDFSWWNNVSVLQLGRYFTFPDYVDSYTLGIRNILAGLLKGSTLKLNNINVGYDFVVYESTTGHIFAKLIIVLSPEDYETYRRGNNTSNPVVIRNHSSSSVPFRSNSTYTSSNTDIATVDSNGKVNSVSEGCAFITIHDTVLNTDEKYFVYIFSNHGLYK